MLPNILIVSSSFSPSSSNCASKNSFSSGNLFDARRLLNLTCLLSSASFCFLIFAFCNSSVITDKPSSEVPSACLVLVVFLTVSRISSAPIPLSCIINASSIVAVTSAILCGSSSIKIFFKRSSSILLPYLSKTIFCCSFNLNGSRPNLLAIVSLLILSEDRFVTASICSVTPGNCSSSISSTCLNTLPEVILSYALP